MDYSKVRKIHFTGVKGVGMAPLAIIAKEAKFEVSGSDVEEVFITDQELKDAGVEIKKFSPENVLGADLVITTGAHGGMDNVEVKESEKLKIPVLSQGEALAVFQKGEIFGRLTQGISVAGSHGKTTTSAIVATLLRENSLDPSFAIGTGEIKSLGASGHFGKGKYFVAEADEYVVDVVHDRTPKFWLMTPTIGVVTNIDFDHPDIYDSIDAVRESFFKFVERIKPEGILIACGDGEENSRFIKRYKGKKVTYGASFENDISLERVNFSYEKMFFRVNARGAMLGEFSMNVFGEHNAVNALAGIAVGLEIGLSVEQIKKGLSAFVGSKRRMELVGTKDGVVVYDDYAHHPAEIKSTLLAFRKSFPKHKIVCIFQPHMYSRTKTLFNDFAISFSECDQVLLTEIFPSFREKIDKNFSSKLLAEEINKYGRKALYFPSLGDVVEYVASQDFGRNTILITMGAGDVYKVGKEFLDG